MNKKEQLTEAIKKFKACKSEILEAEAIRDLLIAGNQALKPADGLSWDEVGEAIKDAIYGKGQWGNYKDGRTHD